MSAGPMGTNGDGPAADLTDTPAEPLASLTTAAGDSIDVAAVEGLYRRLLLAIGEDPDRPGLAETPRRVAAWWAEFLNRDPGRLQTSFPYECRGHGWVSLGGIATWSLCEHHLLPFSLQLTIAYIPAGRVAGLSKLVRIAHACASRLQLQERLTDQVAAAVAQVTGAADVGVWAHGEHLCMSMRGIRAPGALTTTACLLGRLGSDPVLADRLYAAACPRGES